MTTPKIGTIKRGGSRFYVHPESRAKVPGVTSVVGMLPKDFLKFWVAKVTAEAAVDNLGALVTLALNDRQGAVDYLKRAHLRNVGEAADVGTEVHDLVERLARGESIGRVHPDLEPYVRGWHEFNDEFEPEYLFIEETVWSDTYGYAGSFDAIVRIGDEVLILDNKTTRSGVHAEVSLQMTAYARADYIVRPDGTQEDLPDITGAAVLHLRPEGWRLVPVLVSDRVFDVFRALLQVHEWDREMSATVLGADVGGRQF